MISLELIITASCGLMSTRDLQWLDLNEAAMLEANDNPLQDIIEERYVCFCTGRTCLESRCLDEVLL